MTSETEDAPVPPQWQPQPLYDFRSAPDGPRGFKINVTKYGNVGTKRKLEEYSEQVERDQAEIAMADEEPAAIPAPKRTKHNTVGNGRVSGRSWKQPAKRAGTLRNPALSSTWEKKMKDKAEIGAYRTAKKAAIEARKEEAREKRRRREDAKKRKEENRAKSVVTQRVSASTAKRMMKNKKLKKKLVTVDK